MIGMSAAQLVGKSTREVFRPPNAFSDIPSLFDLVRRGKVINNHPITLREAQTNSPCSLLATVLPLPGSKGATAGAVLCLIEACEPAHIQRYVMNSIADGVFTVDLRWKITSLNKAAETITGWTADEAVGRSCSEVFHASICGKTCAIAESLYSGRPVSNRSITIRNLGGEKIPVSISASPLVDHEGNIIGGVETFRDLRALTSRRKQLDREHQFNGIIPKNKTMQQILAIIPEISSSPSTVLIYGESGTGKDLIARAIYADSDRSDKPFVTIDCDALPESQLESKLFGCKTGVFPDACNEKEGSFAAAAGGTLFLDEIGDIPISIQAKLLRALQQQAHEPPGSNSPVKTSVRIITATGKDLQRMVVDGTFREDLYYRLNVVRIHLPPLRERKEDLPLLIDRFIEEFSAQQGKDIVGISLPAMDILMRHDFPGNIRELKNIIEYAFILCEGGYILPEHLPHPFAGSSHENSLTTDPGKPRTLEEIEKHAISRALENNGWAMENAAEELDIAKDALQSKMTRYNLDRPNPPPGKIAD